MPATIRITRSQYRRVLDTLAITAQNLSTLQIQIITGTNEEGDLPPRELICVVKDNLACATIDLMREAI